MGIFDGLLGGGSDTAKNNARKGAKELKQGIKKGRKDINKAEEKSIYALTQAGNQGRADLQAAQLEGQSYLAPIADAAGGALTSYGNFYGQGGVEGFGQAQSDWESSPLFQAMTDQNKLGIQGIDRTAHARGNIYNFTDKADYLGAQAGKYLGDYTSGLWNMAGLALPAAQSQSLVATGTGGRLADLGYNVGNAQSGVNMQSGLARAGLRQNAGQAGAGMYANLTAAQNTQDANSANMWGNILGLAGKVGSAYAGNPSAFA